MRIVAVNLTARRVQHTQHRGGARGAEGSSGGEWLRTAGKPKQARVGFVRISPSSAGASIAQSAHSSAGRLTDAAAGVGFACSSEQPGQLLHDSACTAQQVRSEGDAQQARLASLRTLQHASAS